MGEVMNEETLTIQVWRDGKLVRIPWSEAKSLPEFTARLDGLSDELIRSEDDDDDEDEDEDSWS